MQDRGGREYVWLMERRTYSPLGKPEQYTVRLCLLSPTRQAKKATGLSGRQWVRFVKRARRAARKADADVAAAA